MKKLAKVLTIGTVLFLILIPSTGSVMAQVDDADQLLENQQPTTTTEPSVPDMQDESMGEETTQTNSPDQENNSEGEAPETVNGLMVLVTGGVLGVALLLLFMGLRRTQNQ